MQVTNATELLPIYTNHTVYSIFLVCAGLSSFVFLML